jgi:hypothetical protein
MNLHEYFESTSGRGVLATADSTGKVDAAVYARPRVMNEDTVAFIMSRRLTHENLQSNPHAVYLFMEAGEKYEGKRLFLTKTHEQSDRELIQSMRRRRGPAPHSYEESDAEYVVYFKINKVLPLIGSG